MSNFCEFISVSNSASETRVPIKDVPYSPCIEKLEQAEESPSVFDSLDHDASCGFQTSQNTLSEQLGKIQTEFSQLKGAFARVSEQVDSNNKLVNACQKILQDAQTQVREAYEEQSCRIEELKAGQSEHLSVMSSHVSETNVSYRNLYIQLHKALVWHGENLKSTIDKVVHERTRTPSVSDEKTPAANLCPAQLNSKAAHECTPSNLLPSQLNSNQTSSNARARNRVSSLRFIDKSIHQNKSELRAVYNKNQAR
jgi:hypothetical protein